MREPLARPGTVIRRLRGTIDEHMAALPKDSPAPRRKTSEVETGEAAPTREAKTKPKPPPKPKPRPDRAPLMRAEEELAKAEARHEEERAALAKRQAELDHERRKLEADQARERERLDKKVDTARDKYDRAMDAWRAD